ncbi:MAG TPA: UvrD-helicase domain-containing protein [Burkholderiaceae bacterium]|nr:UvrD-helicase domain-containing protein [Burkholderiaceae bacterium]
MSQFSADGQPISLEAFTHRACDPSASVLVEACAGSGKTWLLVSRIVRALLAGAAPGQILAITFTRRAAQEMRSRLLADLAYLAGADEPAVVAFLTARGLGAQQAQRSVPQARGLYERVVTAPVPMTIETFHGWFWRLVAHAPLGSGVPFAPVLLEATDRLRRDAWLHFSAALMRDDQAPTRQAWEMLIDELGDHAAHEVVGALLEQRAQWWSFASGDEAAARARVLALFGQASEADPAGRLRAPEALAAMQALLDLLASVPKPTQTMRDAVAATERCLRMPSSDDAAHLEQCCAIWLTKEGRPKQLLSPERVSKHLAGDVLAERYANHHASWMDQLCSTLRLRALWRARRIHEAALLCAQALTAQYQRLKAQQQALDFNDLEWHAYRLLDHADSALYLQARLDARYRHILLDEFQDTNALQWQVLRAWLAAYGQWDGQGDVDRPSVFIVGDPKQSIYRFRGAQPGVFEAACELLQRDFAAQHLRTNVTRRNARRVVEVLNAVMSPANALYQRQSTVQGSEGRFVLLPLAQAGPPLAPASDELRDVLTTARDQRERDAHYREGRALAGQLAQLLCGMRVDCEAELGGQREATWADVLLLVRRRTHLADYERALRDAGVPYVSDRRGGLLGTLEAEDLCALLGFLITPADDLKLAHALRSPIFGCSDAALMSLLRLPGRGLWQRLGAALADAAAAPEASLRRAHALLTRWADRAGVLPVHDLLDNIYFEGDVRRRYAQVVPSVLQSQVQANLDAFIELALSLDAGRYPSLSRFIDELAHLKNHASDEAPDEGAAHVSNALRILTIHAAKGLEAEVVALADTHVRTRADGQEVLVVWPPQASRPEHVSILTADLEAQDDPRGAWLAKETAQHAQEDWNLLYVAATRARQALVVSGVAPAKSELTDTWYTRMQMAQTLSEVPAQALAPALALGQRQVADFLPDPCPVGEPLMQEEDSEAQRLGRYWHALLEDETFADGEQTLAWCDELGAAQRVRAQQAARLVRACHPQFFGAAARAEVEIVNEHGELLRLDRLAELPEALWIIDFKWQVGADQRAIYEAQVRRYGQALAAIRPDKPIRLGLIDADGKLIEVMQM